MNALIKRRSTIITTELLRTRNNILIPQIYRTHLEEFNRSSIHTFSLRFEAIPNIHLPLTTPNNRVNCLVTGNIYFPT